MKKRFLILGAAILVFDLVLIGVGCYLKYAVLKPIGMGQDKPAAQLPFIWLTDQSFRKVVHMRLTNEATPSTKPSDAPTAPTTEPTTKPTEPPTVPTTEPTTKPTEPPKPDFVPDSWYDDVLFIGDSRTVGLRDYARSGNAAYFCAVGMTVFDYSGRRASDLSFSDETLDSLLRAHSYGKIFVGLGINECGYPTSSLIDAYQGLVEYLCEKQPNAVIILESIMTVGEDMANSASYFEPKHLFEINDRIKSLADNWRIFYIDANERFADERGYLPDEVSGDGCHLYAKNYQDWAEWISHAVAQCGLYNYNFQKEGSATQALPFEL